MYLREGFVDYLSKPIDQVELDRILREQLKIDDNNMPAVNSNSVGVNYVTQTTTSQTPPVVNNGVENAEINNTNESSTAVPPVFSNNDINNVTPQPGNNGNSVAPIFSADEINKN